MTKAPKQFFLLTVLEVFFDLSGTHKCIFGPNKAIQISKCPIRDQTYQLSER